MDNVTRANSEETLSLTLEQVLNLHHNDKARNFGISYSFNGEKYLTFIGTGLYKGRPKFGGEVFLKTDGNEFIYFRPPEGKFSEVYLNAKLNDRISIVGLWGGLEDRFIPFIYFNHTNNNYKAIPLALRKLLDRYDKNPISACKRILKLNKAYVEFENSSFISQVVSKLSEM